MVNIYAVRYRLWVIKMKRFRLLIAVLLLCALNPAYAYVDPGTGLMVLQGLFAAIGFAVAFIKNPVRKLKELFKRIRKKQ